MVSVPPYFCATAGPAKAAAASAAAAKPDPIRPNIRSPPMRPGCSQKCRQASDRAAEIAAFANRQRADPTPTVKAPARADWPPRGCIRCGAGVRRSTGIGVSRRLRGRAARAILGLGLLILGLDLLILRLNLII